MSTTPIIKHPERIDAKWFPLTNTIEVDVIRTATLSDDLSEIVTRRVARIDLTLGQGDRRQTLSFDRDEADWISVALAGAVMAADATKQPAQTDAEEASA